MLFLQLSTARWIKPLLPRRHAFNSARAHPTVLHSVSYTKRFPRYWSLLQHARGYTQFSVLNSGFNCSTFTDSTSQRMVYSILTRSLEYSKAIHCTPLLSCRTTRGVVAGIGPGAALGFTPLFPPGTLFWLIGGPLFECCCGPRDGGGRGICGTCGSILVLGLPVMPGCAFWLWCCCCSWCWLWLCDISRFGWEVMEA